MPVAFAVMATVAVASGTAMALAAVETVMDAMKVASRVCANGASHRA